MIIELLRLLGRVAEPAALLIVFLLASIVATMLRRWRTALLLQATALAIITVVGIFPGGVWLALPLEKRFAANPPCLTGLTGSLPSAEPSVSCKAPRGGSRS